MKTYIPVSFFLILLITFICGSCKKIDQSTSVSQELIGTWKLTEFGTDDNGNGKIDSWELSQVAAGLDDELTFSKNGQGKEITKENNASSLELDFYWSVSGADSVYRIGTGHEDITYYISNIGSSNLSMLEETTSGLVGYVYTRK